MASGVCDALALLYHGVGSVVDTSAFRSVPAALQRIRDDAVLCRTGTVQRYWRGALAATLSFSQSTSLQSHFQRTSSAALLLTLLLSGAFLEHLRIAEGGRREFQRALREDLESVGALCGLEHLPCLNSSRRGSSVSLNEKLGIALASPIPPSFPSFDLAEQS
ncbi:hypothetical protein JIQ42_06069 [Leishmania sp. Namibia]|uniref:hypothetical protein n=1 Tax=Leishmania sp. Namibia TaxID=2802991 RepID=UPI001B557DC0|nr:hypothetical protein JIQ42_06069 [Leishmania sp. Namibia]